MSVEELRALQRIVRELSADPAAGEELAQARALLAAYERRVRLEDDLSAPWVPPRKGKPKKPYKRRTYPRKAFSRQYALSILRESREPLSLRQVRERLAEYYKPLSRQGVHYALRGLSEEGLAEKVSRRQGKILRVLWRSVD